MYIKIENLVRVIMSILIAHIVFMRINSLYFSNYLKVTFFVSVFLIMLMIPQIGVLFKEKNKKLNLIVMLLCGIIGLSAILNKGLNIAENLQSFTFISKLLCLILFYEISEEKKTWKKNLRIIFFVILFYAVATDVLMFIDPRVQIVSASEVYSQYLVGNKFEDSYLHFWLAILFPNLFKKREYLEYVFIGWTLLTAIFTQCSTMIIGSLFFLLLIVFHKRLSIILENNLFTIVFLFFSSTILILFNGILKIAIVQRFIVEVLHENATLTGRTNIYSNLGMLFQINPILGAGLESNYIISYLSTGATNVQNGILDNYISWGLLGVITIVIFMLLACQESRKIDNYIVICAIYTYIFASSVEIVFRFNFVTLLVIAFTQRTVMNTADELNMKYGVRE